MSGAPNLCCDETKNQGTHTRVTGNFSLYAHILPSPRRCPVCCEILDPLEIVRLEGGGYISEHELAFPEKAWDMGYLTHLCFHPHLIKPTKAERTLREK